MNIDHTADVEGFLQVLRLGNRVPADLENRIAKFPTIDQVRSRLQPADIPLLVRMAGTDPQASGGTAFALLVPFAGADEVARFLTAQWQGARSFIRKNNVMWPLLEIPDLSIDLARECFSFVSDHLDAFVDNCRPWWHSPQAILELAESRMSRPNVKPAKEWIYLCVAMGSPRREELLKLLEKSQLSSVGITAVVARSLRSRLVLDDEGISVIASPH